MQQTFTSTPQTTQVAQVIPVEPSLKLRRYLLLFSVMMLVIFVITLFLNFLLSQSLDSASSLYSEFWRNSFLSPYTWYIFYPLIYLFQASRWKMLDKRRQQAAHYNLTVGSLAHMAFQPDLSDLPARLTIRLRRNWLTTFIVGLSGSLFLALFAALFYSYWQDAIQGVIHQGEPLVLAFLQSSLNALIFLVWCAGFVAVLLFAPRQQLIATQDGLICRRGYHVSYIPWQQARLFAIIGEAETKKGESVFFYEVSSKDAVIRWASQPNRRGSWSIPSAVVMLNTLAQPAFSLEDHQQKIQTLNAVVVERTKLPLCDLR